MSRSSIPVKHDSFLVGASQRDVQRVQDALFDEERATLEMEKLAMRKVHAACAKIELAASEFCPSDFIETGARSFFYWAKREGRDVWKDKSFRKSYLRDNPECRRKVRSTRTVITANTPWHERSTLPSLPAPDPTPATSIILTT